MGKILTLSAGCLFRGGIIMKSLFGLTYNSEVFVSQ